MNKRITCLVITAALMLGIFLLNAPTAQATEEEPVRYTLSQAAIDILKEDEGFEAKPYWDFKHYSIGYGTLCPNDKVSYYTKNPITEEEGEKMLREHAAKFENSVYRFADKYGLKLTQYQLDALVLFSYNVGSAWTTDTDGIFHTAIAKGATGNELINAFVLWSKTDGNYTSGKLRRRRCDANMYLNGVYSRTSPDNYCWTLFKLNGGESKDYLVQGYDSNITIPVRPVATREGYIFAGWYTEQTGGEKVTILDSDTNGVTLYAQWIPEDGSVTPAKPKGVKVTVTAEGAQHYAGPGAAYEAVVGSAAVGAKILIEETTVLGETTWGRYGENWIDLSHTDYEAVMEEIRNRVLFTAKIDVSTKLNIRSGPGTKYDTVGSYKKGVTVEVHEVKKNGSVEWGRTDKGWISLDYVKDIVQVWVEPEEPDEPVEPDVPTEPDEPVEPDVPTEPDVPVVPDEPTEPDVPVVPDEPTEPDVPVVPDEPTEPDVPVVPDEPTEPDVPTEPADPARTGVVSTSGDRLRVREEPTTDSSVVGYLQNNAKVTVTEQKVVGSVTWGRVEMGWVSMQYVKLDPVSDNGSTEPTPPADTTPDTTPDVQEPANPVYEVTASSLNIRKSASSGAAKVGSYKKGAKVTVLETKKVGSTTWAKTDKGWVSMEYLKLVQTGGNAGTQEPDNGSTEPTPPADTTPDVQEPANPVYEVTASSLNIRKSASSSAKKVGSYKKGTKVTVLETKKVSSTTWAKTDKGWVSMEYLKLVQTGSNAGSQEPETQEPAGKTYTVTASSLNIRKSASSSASKVGSYKKGAKITVLETKKVGSVTWGRTSKGWISMQYVK